MSTGVAAAAASATGTSTGSILGKPLREITEDDIAQLTREDCRRYLKSKGMRRPSWNKSQAIQQVIALKRLLESQAPADPPCRTFAVPRLPPPDATALSPPEIPTPLATSNSSSPVKELSPAEVEVPSGLDPPRSVDSAQATADHRAVSLRDIDVSDLPVGQMTIFYCGKVNVYDGVPVEKAQTIMHLAASSIQFFQDELMDGNSAQWRSPGHFPGSSVKVNVIPATTTVSHPVQNGKVKEYIQQYRQERNVPHEADIDGQSNRQVSLQRYREKRKDRVKFKTRKRMGASSSSLEMYLNHQT